MVVFRFQRLRVLSIAVFSIAFITVIHNVVAIWEQIWLWNNYLWQLNCAVELNIKANPTWDVRCRVKIEELQQPSVDFGSFAKGSRLKLYLITENIYIMWKVSQSEISYWRVTQIILNSCASRIFHILTWKLHKNINFSTVYRKSSSAFGKSQEIFQTKQDLGIPNEPPDLEPFVHNYGLKKLKI